MAGYAEELVTVSEGTGAAPCDVAPCGAAPSGVSPDDTALRDAALCGVTPCGGSPEDSGPCSAAPCKHASITSLGLLILQSGQMTKIASSFSLTLLPRNTAATVARES